VEEGAESHLTQHYRWEGYDVHLEIGAYPTKEGGVAVFWHDVTERVRAEQALRELNAALEARNAEVDAERGLLRTVLDQLPVAVVIAEAPSGKVLAINDGVIRIWGEARPHTRAVGSYSREWVGYHRDGRRVGWDEWPLARAVLRGEVVSGWVCEIDRADGSRALIETSAAPTRDAEGRVMAAVAVISDVTAQVHSRAEVERLLAESERARADAERARAEAEAANRAKSEFLAVMSHELRTPLNAIGGYVELMEMGIRGAVSAAQREDLARIQRSQRHLLGLINEVLNYAKIETGSVRYEIAVVHVRDALSAAEGLVAPQIRAKGLELEMRAGPPGLAVLADSEKLRQVLVNLLSNAVKFTDRGGRVVLACEEHGESVHLSVRDTGIGIPADKLEAIFEPFVQVRADLARTAEGTGLGLAISRDLARGMGGDLEVESESGAGSTFTLVLPRSRG
jgi:signal transduction histidine kinase